MPVINEIFKSAIFVFQADFFYQVMALVTIIAIMIGSIIYNGDVDMARKAIISILAYGGMIILTNLSRISSIGLTGPQLIMNQGQAYNGTTTTIFVTFFYLIGILLGVWMHKRVRK